MTIVKMVGDWQRPHRQFVPPVVPVEGGEGEEDEEDEGEEEQERNCFLAAFSWVGSNINDSNKTQRQAASVAKRTEKGTLPLCSSL